MRFGLQIVSQLSSAYMSVESCKGSVILCVCQCDTGSMRLSVILCVWQCDTGSITLSVLFCVCGSVTLVV